MNPSTVYSTPLVRKLAEQLKVDLSQVKGSGAGGRITPADVRKAAPPQRTTPTGQELAAMPSGPSRVEEFTSAWNSGVTVKVNVYAKNPLVDDARQSTPANYAAATAEGPTPTLFASGDLPVFIASGADPRVLLSLPWWARHAAANADAKQLTQMLERYAGDGWLEAAIDHSKDGGNNDYQARVSSWLRGRGADPFTKPSAARQLAEEETYQTLFGAQDAAKAAAAQAAAEDKAARAAFEKAEAARLKARATADAARLRAQRP